MKQFFGVTASLVLVVFFLPLLALGGSPSLRDDGLSGAGGYDAAGDGAAVEVGAFSGDTASPAPSPLSDPSGASGDGALIVKILVGDTVTEMSMRDYLIGVVAAEMPADFPEEALKAQAVAARTVAENKMRAARGSQGPAEAHKGADVCDNYAHCQAWLSREEAMARWGDDAQAYSDAIQRAVYETDSLVITYEDEPIVAVFHAASSGHTEKAADVWGADIPYLLSVESPGEEESPQYHGRVELSAAAFKAEILELYPDAKLDGAPDTWFGAPVRSESGGVLTIPVGGAEVTGTAVRAAAGLRSTNFTVSADGGTLIFLTVGYGHGVGLSQYGARARAREGKDFIEILKWYYTGVEVAEYHPAFE